MTERAYQPELLPEEEDAAQAETPPARPENPAREERARRRAEREAKKKTTILTRIRETFGISPGLIAMGLATALVVVVTLMSYAQLVMVNDEVFSMRSQLNELDREETKLQAQYELAYDLQEIETKLLTSGEMIKIQSWQTYTLELAEPDSVEYHRSSKLGEKLKTLAGEILTGIQEYF